MNLNLRGCFALEECLFLIVVLVESDWAISLEVGDGSDSFHFVEANEATWRNAAHN